ncbi:hypothetical protein PG988_005611 [Apiospora saccharicola]
MLLLAKDRQTDTAVAQKSMGINRKRKRGQQQNGSSKRARTATTVSTSGSPALATSVAPVAAALSPDQQPLGGAIDQQMQAPVARAPSVNPFVSHAAHMGINRKRERGQQQNGRTKRARSATTVSASGSPALATSVALLHKGPTTSKTGEPTSEESSLADGFLRSGDPAEWST